MKKQLDYFGSVLTKSRIFAIAYQN